MRRSRALVDAGGAQPLRATLALSCLLCVVFVLLPPAAELAGEESGPEIAGATSSRPSFAVVELYTSEGCSSCPPADQLLSELIREAQRDKKPVFALAFHVDYWNRLGWTDPWSDAAFSERQAFYARRFESRYTPQMIVNGTEKFVGSDRDRARRSIAAALSAPAAVGVQARLVRSAGDPGRLRVAWGVDPVPRRATLRVALVERGLASQVARGENRGRRLTHDNVVRDFRNLDLPATGQGELAIDPSPDVRLDQSSIILFVQDSRTSEVLGATGIDVGSPVMEGVRR